jgi:hypothetical protein
MPDSVTVGMTARPSLQPGGTLSMCYGESLELDVGSGYVSYQWNTGARTQKLTVDTSGTYWAEVTDAGGCVLRSDTAVVFVRPEISPVVDADGPLTFCDGDSVALSAPLGFRGYEWSSGELVSSIVVHRGGTYSVKVFSAVGCTGQSDLVTITVLPLPARPTVTVSGSLLSSSAAFAYQWHLNGIPIPGARAQTYQTVHIGTYHVEVFNADGCSILSDPVEVTVSGIDAAPQAFDLDVYPDPTYGEITIFAQAPTSAALRISVLNLLGQHVAELDEQHVQGSFRRTISLRHVSSGVYILRVRLGGDVVTRRIVKQ